MFGALSTNQHKPTVFTQKTPKNVRSSKQGNSRHQNFKDADSDDISDLKMRVALMNIRIEKLEHVIREMLEKEQDTITENFISENAKETVEVAGDGEKERTFDDGNSPVLN